MATTKIRAVRKTIKKALDYIMNEKKTDDKTLVSGINCSPEIAYIEFQMTKDYFDKNGKNLAYHITQSFKPGEVDKDTAHEIGVKFAEKLFSDKYQAVIATHTDKDHIHNHIIFNSVSHVSGKKYNDCKSSYSNLREISDDLCRQYGLSIVEKPKQKGKQYKEWQEIQNGSSWKEVIRKDTDETIRISNSFEEFISKMKAKDYEIKNGKYISFKPRVKERYVRGKTLGADYTEESIRSKIALKEMGYNISTFAKGTKIYRSSKNTINKIYKLKGRKSLLEINIRLAIAIIKEIARKRNGKNLPENFIQQKISNAGYSRVQHLARQLSFLTSQNIKSYRDIAEQKNELVNKIKAIRQTMKEQDGMTKWLEDINRAVNSYKINKPIYDEINKKIFKSRHQKKHEVELKTYEHALYKMQSADIKTEGDIELFENRYHEHIKKVKTLEKEYESLKALNQKYEQLERTIQGIKEKRSLEVQFKDIGNGKRKDAFER